MGQQQMRAAAVLAGVVGLAAAASAGSTFTEGFENFSNEGGWTLGGPNNMIETTGGNPGYFMTSPGLDTFLVQLRTTEPSAQFTGDYRSRNVSGFSLDARLDHVDFSAAEREMTLALLNDNGTPDDFEDDSQVYFISDQIIPQVGQGWLPYSFAVPSASTTLPAGWSVRQEFNAPPMTDDEVWNTVISDVDQVIVYWGDPELFYIFQMWEPGVDNISIVTGASCPADFDNSGDLTLADFVAFRNAYVAGDLAADFDQSGTLTLADFVAFRNAYVAGCP